MLCSNGSAEQRWKVHMKFSLEKKFINFKEPSQTKRKKTSAGVSYISVEEKPIKTIQKYSPVKCRGRFTSQGRTGGCKFWLLYSADTWKLAESRATEIKVKNG